MKTNKDLLEALNECIEALIDIKDAMKCNDKDIPVNATCLCRGGIIAICNSVLHKYNKEQE